MSLSTIAAKLHERKRAILERWRTLARSDARHASCRIGLDDEALEDHLPSLFDKLVACLDGRDTPELEAEGAAHGSQRRGLGYAVTELLWEMTLFRRVVMDAVDALQHEGAVPHEEISEVRSRILDLIDASARASVGRWNAEAERERDRFQDELRAASEHKDRFLAMLAHELRNPVAPILNAASMLRHATLGDPRLVRARDIIERQARYQARLIDDLLDVNRITRGKIELKREHVDFQDAVRHAVETCGPAIEAKKQHVDVRLLDGRVEVFADPTRLAQVTTNLLTNAIKFTPSGGHIGVAVTDEAGEAVLRVRDDGAGISPTMLPRVFDLFAQADTSLDRSTGGLGIGLTLVKALSEAQGGRVEARSEGIGRGAEFVVRMPLAGRHDTPQIAGAARRVFVVDDNEDSRETLADVLRLAGLAVETASDGEQALARAAEERPDAYVVDVGLPRMDGYEVARRLRQMATARPPILIALTGYGTPEDRKRALDAGFDHHMTKPADVDELRRLLAARSQVKIES